MKVLVAYYSLEGSTKCIGDAIAELLDADVEEIRTKRPIKADKFMDYYWGGNKEHPNEMVELEPVKRDPRKYDLIFLGTPVWAWAPAPPIYSYLKKFKIQGKKIALFTCSEGERGRTFSKMEKLLPGNEIISRKEFINPKKDVDGSCDIKTNEWARKIVREVSEELFPEK